MLRDLGIKEQEYTISLDVRGFLSVMCITTLINKGYITLDSKLGKAKFKILTYNFYSLKLSMIRHSVKSPYEWSSQSGGQ